ncbi:hypothetical protein J437_LFUL017137 [Ladona fulva]|uniref:Reverse transcriptase domain-containing protein n=1 Tax=Ladona fulva TaxID=123851 RepID=A0A8K0KPE1_LADFU|nr:hypothetical protein J437_LFUL017137 [Ladona fulva]
MRGGLDPEGVIFFFHTTVERSTKDLIKKSSIPAEEKKKITPSGSRPPRIYHGLPKIHKEDVPLRPIVSTIGSPTYKLARFFARALQPHVGRTPSYVKNSRHFIEILRTARLKSTDILVSFDVKSLFTCVPIDDSLGIVNKLTERGLPKDYLLIEFCLRTSYYLWDGHFYEKNVGASMGSPLSPVIANLYIEEFEKKALESVLN